MPSGDSGGIPARDAVLARVAPRIRTTNPMPGGHGGRGGGGGRVGSIVGRRAARDAGNGLGAAPDHAGDLARLVGTAREPLEREQAAPEAVAEASRGGAELEGDG